MHFAAWLSVGDSVTDPAGYYANNVGGTLALLEAMVRASVRHLVFSSSCAVFGEPERVPIAEDHPTRPINAYGETKLAVERALPHYARAYGLQSVALRYFNAAGADPDGALGEDHRPEIPAGVR
jgi:UDP-glucose 4-epimerase